MRTRTNGRSTGSAPVVTAMPCKMLRVHPSARRTPRTVAGGQVGEDPVSREPQPVMPGLYQEILGMVVKGQAQL